MMVCVRLFDTVWCVASGADIFCAMHICNKCALIFISVDTGVKESSDKG